MKRGARHTEAVRQILREKAFARWKRPEFKQQMSNSMRMVHAESSLAKRTAREREKRMGVFEAAAEIEAAAFRLQKFGFHRDADALLAFVADIRRYADKNL